MCIQTTVDETYGHQFESITPREMIGFLAQKWARISNLFVRRTGVHLAKNASNGVLIGR